MWNDQLIMKTSVLQNVCQEVYSKFFSSNNIIISGCNTMSWAPSMWYCRDIVRIKQKVPTKSYCGINITDSKDIVFSDISSFNMATVSFDIVRFWDIIKQEKELLEFIRKFLDENWFKEWIVINLLFENPVWHGFWSYWVFSTLLAMWLALLVGKVEYLEIENYDRFVNTSKHDFVHDLGIKLSNICRKWKAYWSSWEVTLTNTHLPIVYFFEKDEFSWELKPYSYKIDDFLFNNWSLHEIPLDYWVIYLWMGNNFQQNEYLFNTYKKCYNNIKEFMIGKITGQWLENHDRYNFSDVLENDIYRNFEKVSSLLVLKILYKFNSLLESWFDDIMEHEFIQTIKANGKLLSMVEKWNSAISLILFLFKKFMKSESESIWIFPVNSWRIGWSFVFVMKYNKSRDTIDKVMQELKLIWHSDVNMEYCSWRDWTSSDWVKIEQYIRNWRFSRYVKWSNIMFKSTYWDYFMWDYNEIISTHKTGLLLDTINKRIYLNGHTLNSKQILSQTTTIELLEKLISNIGNDVRNNQLGLSSYSKNKNEMLWKIVIPLNKLIEQTYGKKLPLSCRGGMHDFFVRLDEPDIKISVISSIW